MITISNTQVTTYNTCTKAHEYSYIRKLEPRSKSLPIIRGVVGHSALEAYYKEMKEGSHVETCKKAALDVINTEICRVALESPEEVNTIEMLSQLRLLIEAYSGVYRVESFRVLEIEKIHVIYVGSEISYGMILDLLVEFTSGQYKGDIVPVDHKFSYNFKNETELGLDAQLPKIIKTLKSEYFVTKGMFNQIRYRFLKSPNPEDIFRRTFIRPRNSEINQIWSEQIEAVKEIVYNPAKPRRTLSPIICKNCFFQTLCKADLMGEDTATKVLVQYQPRTSPFMDWSGD